METHGNLIDVVDVKLSVSGTLFYDDVEDDHPARDNVLLKSCPPPFSAVCDESDLFAVVDGHGRCYAVADLDNVKSAEVAVYACRIRACDLGRGFRAGAQSCAYAQVAA